MPLAGVRAVVAYDSPQHMIDGNWTEVIVIDQSASPASCPVAPGIAILVFPGLFFA
ncbi:MAG: DUF1326 domain-containing protein [Burkholderiales bacterium]